MKKKWGIPGRMVAAGLLAGTLAGCSVGANTIDAGGGDSPIPSRVTVNSSSLNRRVQFTDARSRQEGMLLHAQVGVENRTNSTLAFEYRWEWTDSDGFQLGDTLSNWQPVVINAHERKMMTGVGPGPAAVNFRLYVRDQTN